MTPRDLRSLSIVLLLLTCAIASSCGGPAPTTQTPLRAERDVAQAFAEAIFRGQSDAAVRLLAEPHDSALSWLATRAARPWKAHHAFVRLPGTRAGRRWVFHYTGTHTQNDGSFEQVVGDLVVLVAAPSGRTGVEFFVLRQRSARFGTHHDSLLLPSNR